MSDSILHNTKKYLGIAETYTIFDMDIIMQINSGFATLNQMGIGPADTYFITDGDAVWSEFAGGDAFLTSLVKEYIWIKAKLGFDPPSAASLLDAFREQLQQVSWRLHVYSDKSV